MECRRDYWGWWPSSGGSLGGCPAGARPFCFATLITLGGIAEPPVFAVLNGFFGQAGN